MSTNQVARLMNRTAAIDRYLQPFVDVVASTVTGVEPFTKAEVVNLRKKLNPCQIDVFENDAKQSLSYIAALLHYATEGQDNRQFRQQQPDEARLLGEHEKPLDLAAEVILADLNDRCKLTAVQKKRVLGFDEADETTRIEVLREMIAEKYGVRPFPRVLTKRRPAPNEGSKNLQEFSADPRSAVDDGQTPAMHVDLVYVQDGREGRFMPLMRLPTEFTDALSRKNQVAQKSRPEKIKMAFANTFQLNRKKAIAATSRAMLERLSTFREVKPESLLSRAASREYEALKNEYKKRTDPEYFSRPWWSFRGGPGHYDNDRATKLNKLEQKGIPALKKELLTVSDRDQKRKDKLNRAIKTHVIFTQAPGMTAQELIAIKDAGNIAPHALVYLLRLIKIAEHNDEHMAQVEPVHKNKERNTIPFSIRAGVKAHVDNIGLGFETLRKACDSDALDPMTVLNGKTLQDHANEAKHLLREAIRTESPQDFEKARQKALKIRDALNSQNEHIDKMHPVDKQSVHALKDAVRQTLQDIDQIENNAIVGNFLAEALSDALSAEEKQSRIQILAFDTSSGHRNAVARIEETLYNFYKDEIDQERGLAGQVPAEPLQLALTRILEQKEQEARRNEAAQDAIAASNTLNQEARDTAQTELAKAMADMKRIADEKEALKRSAHHATLAKALDNILEIKSRRIEISEKALEVNNVFCNTPFSDELTVAMHAMRDDVSKHTVGADQS